MGNDIAVAGDMIYDFYGQIVVRKFHRQNPWWGHRVEATQ